jgi:anti-sigma regulatory factor (Ser/Thr protein kinase)
MDSTVIDTAELVVSELVTNAVRCTQEATDSPTPVCIELVLHLSGGRLLVEVLDTIPQPPRPVGPAAPDQEHGRGLFLVAAFTEARGVRPTPTGKAVWCVVAAARESVPSSVLSPHTKNGSLNA